MSEWISVKERLPDTEERVLVCLDLEKATPIGQDTDRFVDNRRWVRWNGAVTHWMPLPPPPGEEDA